MVSLDIGKIRWITNRLQKFEAMLYVRHLLLNFRAHYVAQRPLPEKLERDDPHGLTVLWVQPETF